MPDAAFLCAFIVPNVCVKHTPSHNPSDIFQIHVFHKVAIVKGIVLRTLWTDGYDKLSEYLTVKYPNIKWPDASYIKSHMLSLPRSEYEMAIELEVCR